MNKNKFVANTWIRGRKLHVVEAGATVGRALTHVVSMKIYSILAMYILIKITLL